MDAHHIHITGASGAGCSTLGAALAARLGIAHLDTDTFYWKLTDPPFREKQPEQTRVRLIAGAMENAQNNWVLSGSIGAWGAPLIPRFDLVVFLYVPTDIRMARLRARETARYGADAIAPGGWNYDETAYFLKWASGYDTGEYGGRSLPFHREWLKTLPCPVLELDGTEPTETLTDRVCEALKAAH
ncbi:MAG TPA: AAA family ATPase [Rhizomicrobium sp.]|nr:AAA family ATPase [Rhizomicrobium sp.]